MLPSSRLNPKASATGTAGALRVVFLYAGFSGLWILLSDRAVAALFRDPATMTLVSIAKGWVFVTVTAMMLFVMVKRLVGSVANREAKLQTLIHAIPDLVWLKNPDGVYLGCNRAFERFFGVPEAIIIGKTDYDFVTHQEADFFRQKDREAMAAGATRANEEWITLVETGQPVLLETLKTPIYEADGTLVGVLGIGRDVTEQRRLLLEQERLQTRLNQAQKLELMGRFAGNVAHDYNNMLSVILANAELVLDQLPPDHPQGRRVQEIMRAARHSAELTGQILAFARQRPGDPRVLDLNEAVSALQGVLERLVGPAIQLDWTPCTAPWKVLVDPTQLDQVLANLVVNARDAIAGPGHIDLATENRTLTVADCAAMEDARPGDHVCLSITDHGCGMTPDLVARIFDPFFTTKPMGKGTGLGLAVVHAAVKENQGVIQVESEPGRGTRFRIYFPRCPTS
jgi:PAS domain S-box-containing protein